MQRKELRGPSLDDFLSIPSMWRGDFVETWIESIKKLSEEQNRK